MPTPAIIRAASFLAALALAAPAGAQVIAPEKRPEAQSDGAQSDGAQSEEADRAALRAELFADLKSAPSEEAARAAEDRIWRFWTVGPDQDSTYLLADAMSRRESYDFAGALAALDILVEREPQWSEPWNQRAFVHFLREEYDDALADIEKTLELEPKHFGALAGKAQILFRQGEVEEGRAVLREAVKIDPWLRERVLLGEKPGKDI